MIFHSNDTILRSHQQVFQFLHVLANTCDFLGVFLFGWLVLDSSSRPNLLGVCAYSLLPLPLTLCLQSPL